MLFMLVFLEMVCNKYCCSYKLYHYADCTRCITLIQLQRPRSALLANAQVVHAHLDLCKMSLLLTKANLANLGVHQHTDDSGLFPQLLQISLNALATIRVLLAVVAEGLLLALVPVCNNPIGSPSSSLNRLLAKCCWRTLVKPTKTCVCWSTAAYERGNVSFFL